jgi:RNA polymerase sigma-70 factor (ECF subfamily)
VVVVPPLDETELIDRARRRDHDAYRELVRRHEAVAFRTAFAIVSVAADAEDVTQEAFVKAYRALGGFRRRAPFRPWLLRIVANEARNRVRSRARRRRMDEASVEAAAAGAADAAPSPEAAALAAEERRHLFAAVSRLRDGDRVAIVSRYFLGLTDAETAAALGVRRGAVKMRVSRALERLRGELEEAGP